MGVALVTGASSGIGAAAAIAFADAGWDVMAAGRDPGRLEEVADVSDRIATWEGDLAASEDCDELVADTLEEFGALDCLVNCAGILTLGDASATSDDDWRAMMHITVDVPFFLSRAALPALTERGGSIVNIASWRGIRADDEAVAYSTAKAALIMLTRAMARDHAAEGVRINAICPGSVDTPMLAIEAELSGMEANEFLALAAEEQPGGAISSPEDIASLVLYLASAAPATLTGATISVDGALAT